jgi:O-antigen ligase
MIGAGVSPIYPLGLIAIVGFVILSLIDPQWAVAVTIVVGMGRISDIAIRFAGTPSIYKPLAAFLGLLLVLQVMRKGYRSLALTRTVGILLVFLLAQSISAIFASDVDVALERLEDLARDFILAFLVACLLRTTRGIHRAVWGLVGLGAVLSALTIYQGATASFSRQFFGLAQASQQHIVGEISEPRSSGPFGDPNFYAQYLVVFAILAVFRVTDERRWLFRLAGLAAFGLNVGAIMLTYSRGGLVALAGAMLLVLWLRSPPRRMVIAGALLVLLVLPAAPPKLVDRVGTMVDLLPGGAQGAGLEISFRGRMSELLAGIQMFADHPIVGVGPGNSPIRYQEYAADIGLEYRSTERATHNTLLEVAAEGGLLSLTLFTLAVLSVCADLRSATRKLHGAGDPMAVSLAQSVLVAIVAFLLAGGFLALTYPRGLWLLMALAIGIRRVAEGAQHGLVSSTQAVAAMPRDPAEPVTALTPVVELPAGRMA